MGQGAWGIDASPFTCQITGTVQSIPNLAVTTYSLATPIVVTNYGRQADWVNGNTVTLPVAGFATVTVLGQWASGAGTFRTLLINDGGIQAQDAAPAAAFGAGAGKSNLQTLTWAAFESPISGGQSLTLQAAQDTGAGLNLTCTIRLVILSTTPAPQLVS